MMGVSSISVSGLISLRPIQQQRLRQMEPSPVKTSFPEKHDAEIEIFLKEGNSSRAGGSENVTGNQPTQRQLKVAAASRRSLR